MQMFENILKLLSLGVFGGVGNLPLATLHNLQMIVLGLVTYGLY
jgi:hypothetical protein